MKISTYIMIVFSICFLLIQIPMVDAPGSCWVQLYEYGCPFRNYIISEKPIGALPFLVSVDGISEYGKHVRYLGIAGNIAVYLITLSLIWIMCRKWKQLFLSRTTYLTGFLSIAILISISIYSYNYGPKIDPTLYPKYLWGWPFSVEMYEMTLFTHALFLNFLIFMGVPILIALIGSKKMNANQQVDPTVKTPVESGNEQGTAGHP